MKKNVTMKDIADKANVSLSTVSLCLNNSGRISIETRKKVLKLAKKLNYVPNLAARELAGKSSDVIGIVLPDYGDIKTRKLLEGISEKSENNNYFNLFCFTFNKADLGRTYINMLEGKNIDALIIFPYASLLNSISKETLYRIEDKGIPIVFVDTYQKGSRVPYVVSDNYRAAYDGVKYLIDSGHKNIAFVGGVYHSVGQERFQGYSDALKENDLYNKSLVYLGCEFDDSIYDIEEDIRSVFQKQEVSALMAYSRNATMATISQAKIFQKDDDFEIIGFDLLQDERFAGLSVYTYQQPHYEMGLKAVDIVLDKILRDKNIKEKKIRLETTFKPLSVVAKQRFALRKNSDGLSSAL
ncbi:LacI family DNA-binding transcriptional regulator [Natronospora cellulosivora (SeqCode)]